MGTDDNLAHDRTSIWWVYLAPALAALFNALGGVLLGFALPFLGQRNNGSPMNGVWIGSLLLAGGVALGIVVQVRQVRAEKKRSRGLTEFNDALSEIQRAVSTLMNSRLDIAAKSAFFDSVVRTGSRLFGLEGVRVCVYELDEADVQAGDQQYLRLIDYGGRSDSPRNEFHADTDHGAAAIDLATGQRQHVCVRDAQRSSRPVDRDPSAVWKSFAAIPLREQGKPRGMLSVDTRERTQFSEEDLAIARTLGAFLVLGMTELSAAASETQPEVSVVLRRLKSIPSDDGGSGYDQSQEEGQR